MTSSLIDMCTSLVVKGKTFQSIESVIMEQKSRDATRKDIE